MPGLGLTISRSEGPTTPTGAFMEEAREIAEMLVADRESTNLAAQGDGEGFSEKGSTGTQFFNGMLVGEEYNQDLVGLKGIQTYDKMWRSDSEVRSAVLVCELPIRRAKYKVEPGTDDAEGKEIAQFVHDNILGGGMTRTFDATLKDIISALKYGFSVGEKCWIRSPDGKVRLKKIAPRMQRTIYRIYPGEDDEIDHIDQMTWFPQPDGTSDWKIVTIPGEKLLWFTVDQEGNNFYGTSLLRAAYFHWFHRRNLYAVEAIACERNAMGVPVFKEAPEAQKPERDRAAAVAAAFHAHQKGYVLVPAGWDFNLVGVTGQTRDCLPLIDHHGVMIVKSVLATFLSLTKGGSYALSSDVSTFFLQALQAIAQQICDVINKQVIRPLVDYNYAGVERYPTLTVTDLDSRDIAQYLRGLAAMFTAKGLNNTAETEDAVRAMAGLPPLTEDDITRLFPTDDQGIGEGEPKPPAPTPGVDPGQGVEADPTEAEPGSPDPKAGTAPETAQNARRAPRRIAPAVKLAEFARKALHLSDSADKAKKLADATAVALALLGNRLADGDIGKDDFESEAATLLEKKYAEGFTLEADDVDEEWLAEAVDAQRPFLADFATAIVKGAPYRDGGAKAGETPPEGLVLSAEGVASRANLYAGGVWTGYQRGVAATQTAGATATWVSEDDATSCDDCSGLNGQSWATADIPQWPGDGATQCLGNCRCYLEYSGGDTE